MSNLQDRIRGSLVGGAIGDALGYPIEFDRYDEILFRYGEKGLDCYDVNSYYSKYNASEDNVAVVSDDTQMTLFTANGLLNAQALNVEPILAIRQAYIEWYFTQIGVPSGYEDNMTCWINDVKRLHVRRAPGNTCMSALDAIYKDIRPKNNSKGCGGVMRVAPIPLYAAVGERMSIEDSDQLAGEAARLTHLHPLGYMPAALVSHIIRQLLASEQPTRMRLKMAVTDGLQALYKMYPDSQAEWKSFLNLMNQAMELAANSKKDIDNINIIGEGWVGDEALAIAVYCALRHFDDFRKALAAAVSHGGDSDSTGAVTGNILGAAIGYEAIPEDFKRDLEMHDLILHMADDLYRGEISKMK